MKLYIWDDVLMDYTFGIMFVVAPNLADARKQLKRICSYLPEEDLNKKPRVYSCKSRVARVVWGGG